MKIIARKFSLLALTIVLTIMALPGIASADGGDDGLAQTVNGYHVALVFANPVTVGENQFHLRVSHAHEMPVTNAAVAVSIVEAAPEHIAAESGHDTHGVTSDQSMHAATGTHDEMGMTALKPGHESGEYAGEIVIDQAGERIVRVHLTVEGELVEVDFPVNVAQPQSGSGILAGFFAANAAIIVAAFVLKRKPASA